MCNSGSKSAHQPMSRIYKPLPQYISTILALSDETPSGLKWLQTTRGRSAGDPVTRKDKCDGFYRVSVENTVYLAHRVVYYLRTGLDPGTGDVIHGPDNPDKDNRKSLLLLAPHKKQIKPPAEEQGNLIYLN